MKVCDYSPPTEVGGTDGNYFFEVMIENQRIERKFIIHKSIKLQKASGKKSKHSMI